MSDEPKYFTEPVPRSNEYKHATKAQIDKAKTAKLLIERFEGEAKKLLKRIESMKEACPHTVWYDEGSYLFTYRYCLACGKLLEEI